LTRPPDAPPVVDGEDRIRRRNLALSSLYLDPNNYRLRDDPRWKRRGLTPLDGATDKKLQNETHQMVLGERNESIRDLLSSLRQNGWVQVEPIHVRKLGEKSFLVIEGNRRVSALKFLQSQSENNGDIGELDPAIFSAVPCLEFPQADARSDLLIMGLQHVGGKRPWHAINQAEMLDELRTKYRQTPDQICASLGLSKRDFNLSIRALALCRVYQQSDWGDQFNKEKYNLFREVLRTPAVREWIGWDERLESATHLNNRDLLFSLLSEELPEEQEGDEGTDEESRLQDPRQSRPPVLVTAAHIKELGNLVADAEAISELASSRSMQQASVSSGAMARSLVQKHLERAKAEASALFSIKERLTSSDLNELDALAQSYEAVLRARRRPSADRGLVEGPWTAHLTTAQPRLTRLSVQKYRGHSDLHLDELGTFNLVVGLNNSGKTSLLESIQLLCHQADPRSAMEVARRRLRQAEAPASTRMVEVLPRTWSLSGSFGAQPARAEWQLSREPAGLEVDLATFVAEASLRAQFDGQLQQVRATFTNDRLPRIEMQEGQARWIRPVFFSSPFVPHPVEEMRRAFEQALPIKQQLVDFLRAQVVPGLRSIDYTGGAFKVLFDHVDEALDLSSMGQGTQRVFHLGLLFAASQNGILLIDEFENALHAGLQEQVVPLFAQLADRFAVQVFCTTHSLESIDAWLGVAQSLGSEHRDRVVCYELFADASRSGVRRTGGSELAHLRKILGLDPRWRT
jgi:ABC-type hemin transport system ATPase subunit